jgi:hypothetical protein
MYIAFVFLWSVDFAKIATMYWLCVEVQLCTVCCISALAVLPMTAVWMVEEQLGLSTQQDANCIDCTKQMGFTD